MNRRMKLYVLCLALLPSISNSNRATAQAEQPKSPVAQQPATPSLDALAGQYTDEKDGGSYTIYAKDGKLVLESARMVPTELSQVSATVFHIREFNTDIEFTLDAAGKGASLVLAANKQAVYKRAGDAVHHVFHEYERSEAMIPMRDGVKLHAVILKPTDMKEPLPILMQRTPYGVEETSRSWFFASRPELARAGYIYVGEDIRGRNKSEGEFLMMRPLADHRDAHAIDESTDTFDTVEWLVKNVAGNNGRVGVTGTSYPGFLAMMAGIDPHPAVKAISPQAPMIDVWMGDDFFHNGAFRQSYGYDYVKGMESPKADAGVDYGKNASGKPVDGFDYFLKRGNFAADAKKSGDAVLPTWRLFLDHPAYDSVWSSRGVEQALKQVTVPTLTVGGYYDQEDMYGPQEEYAKLEPHDAKHENFLALGPWCHGCWSSSSQHIGNVKFGEPIGTEFRERIEAKFFAHYLKDEPGFELANTSSFRTGSNTWQSYSQFPPAESRTTRLHLAGGGALSWSGSSQSVAGAYTSDPADPIPYRPRPIQPTYGPGSQWYDWLMEDQRFVTGRKDVAVWRLPVLDHDLTLTGEVVADIFAATTGSDNDMVVKLIDEYPEDDPDAKMRGYQLMTNAEIFRGRYLAGFDKPEAIAPGSIREYRYSLHDVDHTFKAGHRVMVEIQSTWFPLYDRNPQKFVPNIMQAGKHDYRKTTITIYSGAGHDSALEVPVMGAQ